MTFYKLEDFTKLKGGVKVLELEKIILQLLDYFSINNTNLLEGIEVLNDLLYLKEHDNSVFSQNTSNQILQWIDREYECRAFENTNLVFSDEDIDSARLVKLLDTTLDTLYTVRQSTDVLPLLKNKLELSNNECEISLIEEYIESIQLPNVDVQRKIDNVTLDEVLYKADKYFELQNQQTETSYLLCGLKETIREHNLSYSVGWCIKSEKYVSSIKRTKLVGGGVLMISKISEHIQMAGSAPNIDWIQEFELAIQNLESYWCLEIKYEKLKIRTLKSLLNLSTPELLKKINEDSLIQLEGEYYELQNLEKDLKQEEIDCKLELKKRKKNATNKG